MKKFILYIVFVLGITQLNLSCAPDSKIPFLGRMDIYADSLIDAPFPDSLNYISRGFQLTKEQYYDLCSDSLDNMSIVCIKKVKNNYLLFFARYGRDVKCGLFNEQGKIIDWCNDCGWYMGFNKSGVTPIVVMDSLRLNNPRWDIEYKGDDRFDIRLIIDGIDTLTWHYSVADKMTLVGRTESREIATPSSDIEALPISQAKDACDQLSVFKKLRPNSSGYYVETLGRSEGGHILIPHIRYNAETVLQWIYDNRTNERMERYIKDACTNYFDRYPREIPIDFLRKSILKLKDKKAQEYLLNMEVFKAELSMRKMIFGDKGK